MALAQPYRAGMGGNPTIGVEISGYVNHTVPTSGPGPAEGSNQTLVHRIMAGLMAYDFDGPGIAGELVSMPPDLQHRLGQILFPVIATWAKLAPVAEGYGPSYPLYNECRASRIMLSHVMESG